MIFTSKNDSSVCMFEKTKAEIFQLLRYFNLFNHPLKLEDFFKFSNSDIGIRDLQYCLQELELTGNVKKIGEFYLLSDASSKIIKKRVEGETKAEQLIPRALKVGRLIGHFPFVKFVGVSGSLSKGYADEKSDFDYFIITSNNTLWICRTLLHIFKKLSFLVGLQHQFCMNYFIDECHLKIEEENIFTQIELSSLIPAFDKGLYNNLLLMNKSNLPNLGNLMFCAKSTNSFWEYQIKQYYEKNKSLKWLNRLLMKITDWKWRNKWKARGYPKEDYALAFKTTPFVSKNHPANYQKKILNQFEKPIH